MGRAPCCEKDSVKRGPWTPEEDAKLLACVAQHGTGSWRTLPKKAGLQRCGKSCRLRWTNYLRPDLKHGRFSDHEEQTIVKLHAALGSRWSLIAAQLPGRTDNDVKNYWNTRLKKKLCEMGIDPITHKPISQLLADLAGSMGAMTPAHPNAAGGTMAPVGRTIADAALGCFKDDMLNVIMRRHPSSNAMSTTGSGLSTATSCTSSPNVDRPHLQTLNIPPFMQISSKFRRQVPFSLLQGAAGGGSSILGGGRGIMGGLASAVEGRMHTLGGASSVLGGSAVTTPGLLPPCLQFLNPTSSPSPFHPFLPSFASSSLQDEQHTAKSMMDMLLDTNAINHTHTSSSSTLISGVMPSCANREMNEGASSLKIELGTATRVHVEQNYSLSTQSTMSEKFLKGQLQVDMGEPNMNPWTFSTEEEGEEEENQSDKEEGEPHNSIESSLLSNTSIFNCWASEETSSLHAKSRLSLGDNTNLLAWSPTCTSRSSSTCSNLPGPSDPTQHHMSTPSHNISDQPPLTSVDAMLWDLSDLNAFIS